MSGKPIEITKTIGKQKFSHSKYSTTSHIELYNADSRIFTKYYLRDDGVFVLRIIEKNSSNMITTDLILNLWKIFRELRRKSRAVFKIFNDITH
jgi:hypothetical protein